MLLEGEGEDIRPGGDQRHGALERVVPQGAGGGQHPRHAPHPRERHETPRVRNPLALLQLTKKILGLFSV